MILPQLEDGSHGAEAAGMSFFDDNTLACALEIRLESAWRTSRASILLIMCGQCAVRRNLAEGTLEQCGVGEVTTKGAVEGVTAGCFPQLYSALGGNPHDQVITLQGAYLTRHAGGDGQVPWAQLRLPPGYLPHHGDDRAST